MIEVGKNYTLVMLELTNAGYSKGSIDVTVTGREGNLIEVNGCEVINTASPLFHSLIDAEGEKAHFAKLEADSEASLSGN
ncbi:MAG: hypothetical protein KJ731_08910 [Alphaproteobacteria bacterium]|nr:hypothetical protein [Alphaproteobacteria bacterium]